MNKQSLGWMLLVAGIVAIASSWFSIRPSSAHRYDELTDREAAAPGWVTAEGWVMSKDDEGFTALALIFVGPGSMTCPLFMWSLGFVLTLFYTDPLAIVPAPVQSSVPLLRRAGFGLDSKLDNFIVCPVRICNASCWQATPQGRRGRENFGTWRPVSCRRC